MNGWGNDDGGWSLVRSIQQLTLVNAIDKIKEHIKDTEEKNQDRGGFEDYYLGMIDGFKIVLDELDRKIG